MNLDDLAKAAYEARDDGKIPAHWWAQESEAAKRKYRRITLAVASAVLEMVQEAADGHVCDGGPQWCGCKSVPLDDIRRMVEGMKGSA